MSDYIDADEYYRKNSKEVSSIEVKWSGRAMSGASALKLALSRGFLDYPVTCEYDMEGELLDEEEEVTIDTMDKHPCYETLYMPEAGKLFNIMIMGDAIFANPVYFNLESTLDVPVIISESETLTSYDSVKNKYYFTIPNENVQKVIVVDKIDAYTLKNLDILAELNK